MIHVNLAAEMRCNKAGGCPKKLPVLLVLNTMGGFSYIPVPVKDHGWQVQSLAGSYMTYCPEHHQEDDLIKQVGPAGPRIIRREH